jgi:hypothetical protein
MTAQEAWIPSYLLLNDRERQWNTDKEERRRNVFHRCCCHCLLPELARVVLDYLSGVSWKNVFEMSFFCAQTAVMCDKEKMQTWLRITEHVYDETTLHTLQERIRQGEVTPHKPISLFLIWDSRVPCSLVIPPETGCIFDMDDMSDASQFEYPSSRVGFPHEVREYVRGVLACR